MKQKTKNYLRLAARSLITGITQTVIALVAAALSALEIEAAPQPVHDRSALN